MSAKRKHKAQHKRKSARGAALATARKLPTPEQVVGAVVEAIAAPLLDVPSEAAEPLEEASSSQSGIHAILPRGEAEHRIHPRVPVAVAIGLESQSHFFAGLSGDISEGGVFVETYRHLPVGSAVEILIDLPEGERRAHGQVRWHRVQSDSSPPGIGIAFENLSEIDRSEIQRFCEHRAPLYYDVGDEGDDDA